ncbi:MAG: tetratricopeptide repeat protein [Gammaproteobacteria bacterium]|jgi:tetratricopeptide (TPR) repeat protein|nr:tetratricopeptide repeat protein [Gammaproteobacteria bacterium]
MKRKINILTRVIVPIFCLILAVSLPTVEVQAQDSGGKKKERKTKKAQSMSEKVYTKLTEAQELIEAKNYKDGLAKLRELEQEKKLSPYEKAQLYNYFAYTYFTLEKYQDAIRSYQKVLIQPDLPEGLAASSMYTLAQLYFITEEYKKAVKTIEEWFKIADKPSENAYMLLGQGYYQLEDYKKSLGPLKKAYKLVKDRGDNPKQNLLLLMRVDYYNLGDYENMVNVLKELVVLYPKTEYWLTMAGAYSELKRLDKQMSIMEMLYDSGDLQKGNQQLNLANLFLLHEVPYKAAVIMDKGMKKGIIDKNVRNLRLLSQAWLQAQESEKAIDPLKRAADLSKDGDLDVRLAQAYLNLDKYKEAIAALETGLKKGGVKRRDTANVMLGLANFELQRFNASIKAFTNASKDKRSKKTATQWLGHVRNEKARKKQLEDAIRKQKEAVADIS